MKKIISYSLWGNNPIYTFGALENVYLAKEIFPDWIVRIYYKNIPIGIKEELEKCNNCELILIDNDKYNFGIGSMFRFKILFDDSVDIFIVRDTDSRLCIEDKKNIDIWEKSNFGFYLIQDNPIQELNLYFLAGMWGGKKGYLNNNEINLLLNKFNYWNENKMSVTYYKRKENNSSDQDFLKYELVPLIKNNIMYITTNKNIINDKNIYFADFSYDNSTISKIIYNYNVLKKYKIINFNINLISFAKKRISSTKTHDLIIEIAKKENISEDNLKRFFCV
jgi:hypothetical protein